MSLVDSFAKDHLPPPEQWPKLDFSYPDYQYAQRLNCVHEFLDKWINSGQGGRRCLVSPDTTWTYQHLQDRVNQIAHVLVEDFNLQPGNRVLLRSANNPMLVAAYFAVIKAGGIVVPTMPLLRASELSKIINKARINLALCDIRLRDELETAQSTSPSLASIGYFYSDLETGLEARMRSKEKPFEAFDSASDDICLIAFTSGTTGEPKGTVHFHRDLVTICNGFSKHILRPHPDDLFCGSPPLAFTFGLGGLVLFPLHSGASSLLLEQVTPKDLLAGIEKFKASVIFTAPTAYRAMLPLLQDYDISSLRKGVSAGEHLPLATWQAVKDNMGIALIDGLGSTEMLHVFIAVAEDDMRPGATGKVLPGYQAAILDSEGNELPPGQVGRLAIKGPTGCRYLDDERQKIYVQNGWNITGDTAHRDEDGYYWYHARNDDMIISSGYNIGGPEVENALLTHSAVAECAVVGKPDAERGSIVKAFVVLQADHKASLMLIDELQEHVKTTIAPYKYPREIEFINNLPKTQTGKIQRFKLRQKSDNPIGAKIMHQTILPEGWKRPKGYSNAVLAEGRTLFIAGQIGWDGNEQFAGDDFIDQVRQALQNTVALLEAAGGGPQHLTRMTWYLTDKKEYLQRISEVGQVYREVIGKNYPAMTAIGVTALIEERAKVEIESTAVIPFKD